MPYSQSAQTRITQFYLQITPYLPFLRKHSPDGATHNWCSRHAIAGYYSFIDPQRDERLSWPGWLTNSIWFTHISGHRSATGRAQDNQPRKHCCTGDKYDPGARFTNDLRTNLRHILWPIHRTLMIILWHILRRNLMITS